MKIVDSLDGALRTVIKESDDVEEAQSNLEAAQAKDKSGNKKAAEREEANINRQKEAIENAENRDGQLLQQKKLTLSKKQLNELKAMLKQPKRKPMRQSKTSKKTLPKLSKK